MPTDPTNLMEEVYNLLSNIYLASASKQAFLAFEAFGLPISDAMFKVNPSDTALSPPLAVERISDITNKSLSVRGNSMAWGLATVDGTINLCLQSSMPVNTDAAAPLGAAKRDAQGRFDSTLGSMSGVPDDRFHPVYASPVDWYASSVSTNWTIHTVGQPQPPPKTPPPKPIDPPIWRVLPVNLQPHLGTGVAPGHPLLTMAAPAQAVSPVARAGAPFAASPVMRPVMAMQSSSAIARNAVLNAPSAVASPTRAVQMTPLALTAAVSNLNANTVPQPVTTNSIGMTFEHCIVSLNRPWFPDTFLLLRNWFVAGYARGEISNGSGAGDPGIVPVLTTGFAAIRNLQITSNWSQADLADVQGSAAFGPFSLIGRTFDTGTGTLTCPGVQIIGWFCSPMPVLPPVSDPNAPAPNT